MDQAPNFTPGSRNPLKRGGALRWLGRGAAIFAVALGGGAQQAARPKPAAGTQAAAGAKATPQVTFTANSRLVVENVTVTDRNGQPVTGLTAKDFLVTEDGVAQTVTLCEYQRLDDAAVAAATAPAAPKPAASRPAPGPPTGIQITPETPGVTHYTDRRLLVLYFDMTAMQVPDQLRALDSAQRFVQTQMHPADLMAVMDYEGSGVRVKQDFTADKDALQQTIGKMILGTGLGLDESSSDADAADYGSAFGQDDSEFNIFNTDRQLSALQTASTMLGRLNEKKSLIY
ncbi:MAG: VWA domain-containing protein, partial [Streptosporangiaceae bacterium]